MATDVAKECSAPPRSAADPQLGGGPSDQRIVSIYEQIGGVGAVAPAVDAFYDRLLADPEIAPYFEGHRVGRLKAHQRSFLTAALGGPQIYKGEGVGPAHAGLGITSAHFDRVVDHLVATLQELGVPDDTIGEIGALLGPLKDDIVEETAVPR